MVNKDHKQAGSTGKHFSMNREASASESPREAASWNKQMIWT